jgi:two-component system NtrC family response regulator
MKARIIAATHKPVRPGDPGAALRDDLYYRLAVIEVLIPPLRERRSDIPLLVAHALAGTRARAVTEDAMAYLVSAPWPGNVRELTHVISRAAVMGGGEIIDLPAVQGSIGTSMIDAPGLPAPADISEPLNLREAMAACERRVIVLALERSLGNRSEAARRLGIGRTHLYAKIEEHGIELPERAPTK